MDQRANKPDDAAVKVRREVLVSVPLVESPSDKQATRNWNTLVVLC